MGRLTYSCNASTGAVTVWQNGSPYADLSDCDGSFDEKVERAKLICAGPELLTSADWLLRLQSRPYGEQILQEWEDAHRDAEASLCAAVDRAEGRFVSDRSER